MLIRNDVGDDGDALYIYLGEAVSPIQVKTTLTLASKQISKGVLGTSASVNDTIETVLTFNNPTRAVKTVVWKDKDGKVLKSLDVTTQTSDTLKTVWQNEGVKRVFVTVTDEVGTVCSESVTLNIVKDVPIIGITDSLVNLNVKDTINAVVSDMFGEIVKYEWDFGGTGTFVESVGPKFEITMDTPLLNHPVVLRVTDDDGNVCEKSFSVSGDFVWEKLVDLPVNVTDVKQLYSAGDYIFCKESSKKMWRVDVNGIWSEINDTVSFEQVVYLNGNYYGYTTVGDNKSCSTIIMSSIDGLAWKTLEVTHHSSGAAFRRELTIFNVFKGKLISNYMMSDLDNRHIYQFSSNGADWGETVNIPSLKNSELIGLFFLSASVADDFFVFLYSSINRPVTLEVSKFNSDLTLNTETTINTPNNSYVDQPAAFEFMGGVLLNLNSQMYWYYPKEERVIDYSIATATDGSNVNVDNVAVLGGKIYSVSGSGIYRTK